MKTEKYITKTVSSVRFPEGNKYRFGMDHHFYRNIPSDVDFYPVDETSNGLIQFIGDGYGAVKRYGVAGEYGNGSIHVFMDDIPHLIEWSRNNFLKL